ncbi:MAG: hypothetical protein OHK0023_04630 [Anaerolineae bacterium]
MDTKHALIIDDNQLNIDVLVMLLNKEGFSHVSTLSPREVTATIERSQPVDVVFLDLEFPNGDGFDLLSMLRQHPRLSGVPIIAYSVHVSEIDRARKAGFDGFLGKPLNATRFPEQLQRILSGQAVWEVG